MRRYGELSRGAERSSPRQFFPDCTIAMCGYDFREGQEIAQLKREVTKLKAERDILKKAAAYFAKEST
jgi:transposase-like protein